MRGSKASLTIRQGAEQSFKPVLYIERAASVTPARHQMALIAAIAKVAETFPGVDVKAEGDHYVVTVPDKYHNGHEAHFTQVTENFLDVRARRENARLGSAEHDHEVRHDHAGLREEPWLSLLHRDRAGKSARRAPTVQIATGYAAVIRRYFLHESCTSYQ